MKIIKINNFTYFWLLTAFLCGYIKDTLIILLIVLLHELGHIIIARTFKYKIISINIYPFGGISKFDKYLNEYIYKDLLVSIGGILVQIVLLIFIKNNTFTYYNLNIMFFNLLPIIPLDGSKILFEILNIFLSYKKVINVYLVISLITIIIYIYFNIHYMFNNYMIIILFIYKIIETYKNRKIIFQKFILERSFYDFTFNKIKNNIDINDYQKNVSYYHFKNNKILNDKEYFNLIYK